MTDYRRCDQKPIGLENARRLVRLFGRQVSEIRTRQIESPEHISTILLRIAEKERAR